MGVDGSRYDEIGTAAAPIALRAENLVCRRGERTMLTDLSFEIAAGAALLLTGPNGAGKSSLLRLLAGLLPAAGGRLLWDGAPVEAQGEAHRRRIAYVGHRDAVKTGLTVAENLVGWTSLLGHARAHAAASSVAQALATFALDPLADLPARYLSAGQRRRLALARLLLSPRPLWLLDEPHAGLDAAAIAALETIISGHLDRGGIAIVASHGGLDLPDARRLALGTPPVAA